MKKRLLALLLVLAMTLASVPSFAVEADTETLYEQDSSSQQYETAAISDEDSIPAENLASKKRTTIMTSEKRAIARENIAKHEWAQEEAQAAIEKADHYISDPDWAWNLITSQDLPRAINTAGRLDPDKDKCHYCGKDLVKATGDLYPWLFDVENDPWKLQCPLCFRKFPANDFGKFYEAGINEHGWFDYELAKQNGSQYLTSDKYSDKGENWGVDDGYGYITDKTYHLNINPNDPTYDFGMKPSRHTYIAYYNHWALWYRDLEMLPNGGKIIQMLEALGNAYAYTGDLKYGRVGAIMVDRIADVYPDMYSSKYYPEFYNSDFNVGKGRIIGSIWETGLSRDLCKYYDYFFPAYDDAEVVNFLADKAAQYKLGDTRGAYGTAQEGKGGVANDKSTPKKIRENIENGLLREVIDGVINEGSIYGNSGMHQSAATTAAVVLDSAAETDAAIDWVMGPGKGNVTNNILAELNRDGQGSEGAPGYSNTWVTSYSGVVDVLDLYDRYTGESMYNNVKFVKLIKTNFPLTLARNGTAPIGDSGCFASDIFNISVPSLVTTFLRTKDVEIAQYLYFMNGNQSEGIHGDIFTSADGLADQVQEIIDEHGEYPFDESSAMTANFGFYALRDGVKTYAENDYGVEVLNKNTQRDFWMYFGRTTNHGHPAVLNIGMDAFGIPMLSDFGYPESTSAIPRTTNWDRSTVVHNTVQVDAVPHYNRVTTGTALHFDGDNDGRVQVMDAQNNAVNQGRTSEFRRTTVMVDFNDNISYGVDFFRVAGGSISQLFLLHPVSSTDPTSEDLTFTKQNGGTYPGEAVEYGHFAKTHGLDGFYDCWHAYPTSNVYSLDYKIDNFRGFETKAKDPHLKITQISDFVPAKVTFASCEPPQNNDNPEVVKSMLVLRDTTNGAPNDSLFTTVLQPYDGTPYIAKCEPVNVTRISGLTPAATDKVHAVKVTMKNGRVDYIVYSTNNRVRYKVDNRFDFQGFIGVITYEDGEVTYKFVSDGTRIDDMNATRSYEGVVSGITSGLSFKNSITVTPKTEMDVEDIKGRYIFVNNNEHSYKIQNVKKNANGTYTLDIGDYSLVNGMRNGYYTYDIAAGNTFSIPLTKEWIKNDTSIETENGAQIRTRGTQGIRFRSTIDKTGIDFSRVKEFGTVLIPTADLKKISDLKIDAVLNGNKVAKVPAVYYFNETDDTITFTAVLTGLQKKHYNLEYSARAYAIMDDESVIYADSVTSRSICGVAKKALEVGMEDEGTLEVFRQLVHDAQYNNDDNDASFQW